MQGGGTLIAGTGPISVPGGSTTTINGMTVDDGAVFEVTGTVDQTGNVQFGTTATDAIQIEILERRRL